MNPRTLSGRWNCKNAVEYFSKCMIEVDAITWDSTCIIY